MRLWLFALALLACAPKTAPEQCSPFGTWDVILTDTTTTPGNPQDPSVTICTEAGYQWPDDLAITNLDGHMLVNPIPPVPPSTWSGGVYFPVTYDVAGQFEGCNLHLRTVETFWDGNLPIFVFDYQRDYAVVGSNVTGTLMVTATVGSPALGASSSCTYPTTASGTLRRWLPPRQAL